MGLEGLKNNAVDPYRTRTYKNKARETFDGEFLTMVDVLKKSGVREAVENSNVGSDFYEALDEEVKRLIERAEERAHENNRKTLKSRDV